MRVAAGIAEEAAPDLVGPDASAELARAMAGDRDAYPDVSLSESDQRIEMALGRALDARSGSAESSKATRAAQALLLLVLGVALDRAIPEREVLLRLIVVLIHYLRSI